eukprot:4159264-Pyramimonas_sp.AAC.1
MEAVFGRGQVQPEALPLKDKGGFSDPREDSQAARRKQMGKWRQDTIDTLRGNIFWAVLEISRRARQPLDRRLHLVQKCQGVNMDNGSGLRLLATVLHACFLVVL